MSKPDFEIRPGGMALYRGNKVQVSTVLDLTRVVVRSTDNGEPMIALVAELEPPDQAVKKFPALESINSKAWDRGKTKQDIVKHLLANEHRTRKDVEEEAAKAGVHPATVYAWIARYRETPELLSLVQFGNREPRLDSKVEQIIADVVEEFVLDPQKLKPKRIRTEIEKRCKALELPCPHINTVRLRMHQVPRRKFEAARRGNKAAEQFEPAPGTYEEARWPLAVIQIDHTPLDIIIVDDDERKPIGRAWLTLAIDVYSRMVVGWYISLEAPGNHSLGPCLTQAMLPKDPIIARFHIKARWPVWGPLQVVHADNAGEFRGEMLKRACENRNIDLMWRPVKKPRYGAHIERLNGTLNRALHEVPGTTFSNIKERGDYDSNAMAIMTFDEVEKWIAVRILDVYHIQRHGGIGTNPLAKYESAFMADGKRRGRGLPPRIRDERRLRIEFLPFEQRTVQTYGIRVENITYYADVLRPWVNAPDPKNHKEKRLFYVHMDYRDVSVVYFFDPELNDFFDIPYADLSRPKASYWEVQRAKALLKKEHATQVDEQAIFDAVERLREIEREAAVKTKTARRNVQKRRTNEKSLRDRPTPALPDARRAVPDGSRNGQMTDELPQAFDDVGDVNG